MLIAAGTDGDTPREAAYPALFEELELLVSRAGMTPLEAIRSATQIGAMTMGQGRHDGRDRARLCSPIWSCWSAIPLADIANLRSVLFTVRRGRRFDRADYRPISREEMPDDD